MNIDIYTDDIRHSRGGNTQVLASYLDELALRIAELEILAARLQGEATQ